MTKGLISGELKGLNLKQENREMTSEQNDREIEPHFLEDDFGKALQSERKTASQLDLAEHAKSAALKLEADFPGVVFTSGRRSSDDQARAMAGNVVNNRKWIEQTYKSSPERKSLQDWVDKNPSAKTKAEIQAGLAKIMSDWTDTQKKGFSRHMAGLAFDVKPTDDAKLKKAISELPNLRKFLDEEGGITIWHADFKQK
ncbi:hypothetical protein [uncultured Pelagimonas sp.]|uniref:hypothetical protein n=1 Tax=uncultured Pelagimonas sp. TaxID=1618102 RepID=UPI00262548E4|nr:hypothetical protein [uncultured Pelagimonas sp.]